MKAKDYRTDLTPVWCSGCGDYGVLKGLTQALADLAIEPEKLAVISGIGCSSRLAGYTKSYSFNSVHGRALPIATGLKVARPEITTVVVGGDGDGFSIGLGHIPHAVRRNVNLTYAVLDNGIYGLTKGQTSPTSATGFRTPTSPYENPDRPLNPLLMVLAYGASWVGQAYAGRPDHLNRMITQAMAHRGFSYLHILSPCVTFDKTHRTYQNLGMQVRDLPADHDPSDRAAAMRLAMDDATPALGLYFREERPTLGDALDGLVEKAGGELPGKVAAKPARKAARR